MDAPLWRYTKFPNLHVLSDTHIRRNGCLSHPIADFPIAEKHDVYLAWATVLKGYVLEEQLVFAADDDVVVAETGNRTVPRDINLTTTRCVHSGSPAERTGVFFHAVSFDSETLSTLLSSLRQAGSDCEQDEQQCLGLELHLTKGGKSALLRSCGTVGLQTLEQLGRELKQAVVRTTLDHKILSDTNYAATAIPLSILNQHPQRCQGPLFLHEMVFAGTAFGDPTKISAVEYLPGDPATDVTVVTSYFDLETMVDSAADTILDFLATQYNECSQRIIPLLFHQSIDLYVAMLAVLKAGCAFCPLQLDAPAARLSFVLEDTDAPFVLTSSDLKSRLATTKATILVMRDGKFEGPLKNQESRPTQNLHPGNPAYVLYTSGSTGAPKGVLVSHQAAVQSLLAHDAQIPVFQRFLQFASPTFDVSIFEIFFTLFRRATLVCCDRMRMLTDLPAVLRKLNIDAAELTPTVAGELLGGRSQVPQLKLLLTIGEMLTAQVIKEFGAAPEESRASMLWAMYGPTEASIHCTMQQAFDSRHKVGIIGSPLATTSCFIVDPITLFSSDGGLDIKVLPVGHVGELVLGGWQLASGYLNRPEQTQSAFLESATYGRLYRTGDRARMLPGGTLEILGRISVGQEKLRGQRIELGEIEAAANRATICKGATAAIADGVLALFYTSIDPMEYDNDDILESCRLCLPGFMVPSEILHIEAFPQLPSGKIDRQALLSHRNTIKLNGVDPHPAANTDLLNQTLISVLSKSLGRALNVTEDLRAAGLDSLTSIRAINYLRKAGVLVTMKILLESRTVEDLRRSIESNEAVCNNIGQTGVIAHLANASVRDGALAKARNSEEICQLAYEHKSIRSFRREIVRAMPCTPLQLSMLVETAKEPTAYCNKVVMQFRDPITATQVRDWVTQLVAKNEILRTGFVEIGHASAPFAQIVWERSTGTKIVEMSVEEEATYEFALSTAEMWQRPIIFIVTKTGTTVNLIFRLHHALYDGWSIDLLLNDLETLYGGTPLPDRPQFCDVVSYMHETNHPQVNRSNQQRRSSEFWSSYLQGYQPKSLPSLTGSVDPKAANSRSRYRKRWRASFSLQQLSQAAVCAGISAQVYLQSALLYIVASYHGTGTAGAQFSDGEGDVAISTIVSGRTLPVSFVEKIVGPCVATLPLRVNLEHVMRVKDLLYAVHTSNRSMLDHSESSLADILRESGFAKTATHFTEVLFAWQESLPSRERLHLDKPAVVLVDSDDNLEFRLLLEVQPTPFESDGGGLSLKLTIDPAVFTVDQAEIFIKQLDEVVQLFLDDDQCLISAVPSRMLHRGSNASQNTPHCILSLENCYPNKTYLPSSLDQQIQNITRQDPDRIALTFCSFNSADQWTETSLSYQELNRRASTLADILCRSIRAPEEELICIYMEKSVELYVSVLAVIKTGLGYLPLTPSTPVERLHSILTEASIRTCLTTTRLEKNLNLSTNCLVLTLDSLEITGDLDIEVSETPAPEALAYAIFTSGSTGVPKGVLVTHANLLSNLQILSQLYPRIASATSPAGRLLQACSQAFDVSVFEIFYCWYTGMTLVAAPNDVLFANIESFIDRQEITHLSMTPTVAALVKPANVPSVRFLVTSGEAVTEIVKQRWSDHGLWQGYGPSETTNICTVKPWVSAKHARNNIGRPLSNTSAFVMIPGTEDFALRGSVGELCFGGEQVFRGYLNQPEITRSKIIDHPLFGRIYRSRDLGRLLANGDIVFEGRMDDNQGQVKIRGQRVELGEINAVILRSTDVEDCVSMLIESETKSSIRQAIVAFWLPREAKLPSDEDPAFQSNSLPYLDGGVSGRIYEDTMLQIAENIVFTLPSYMIPSHLVPVSAIPLTSQGKVDKRALRSLFQDLVQIPNLNEATAFPSVAAYETDVDNKRMTNPSTRFEGQISSTLASILGLPVGEVGVLTSFFALGLDSIAAIAFARLLRDQHDLSVTISQILKHSTCRRLSQFIEQTTDSYNGYTAEEASSPAEMPVYYEPLMALFNDSTRERIEIEMLGTRYSDPSSRSNVVKILPCTPLQETMLAATLAGRSLGAYVNTMIFNLAKEVSIEEFRSCWKEMVARHDILRSCFAPTGDSRHAFAQVVLRSHTARSGHFTITNEEMASSEKQACAEVRALVAECLPPYRLDFLRQRSTSGSDTILLWRLTCHHTLYDGTAMALLLQEVEHRYKGLELPPVVPMEPFLRMLVTSQQPEALEFWAGYLLHFMPRSVIDDEPKGQQKTVSSTLPRSLSSVEILRQRSSIPLLSVVQAAWAKVLFAMTGDSDVCFGNVMSGRSTAELFHEHFQIERLVAPTFNTLPVRANLCPIGKNRLVTNIDLMEEMNGHNSEAIAHQYTALRDIRKRIGNRRLGLRGALFYSLVLLQTQAYKLDPLIWTLQADTGDMDVPIVIEVIPDRESDELLCCLHYTESFMSAANAESVLASFLSAFEVCIRFPASMILEHFGESNKVSFRLAEKLSVTTSIPRKTKTSTSIKDIPVSGQRATDTHLLITEAVSRISGSPISQIRNDSTVFEAGIDSLSAIQLIAYLRREKGISVTLTDILRHPRISELVELVECVDEGDDHRAQGVNDGTQDTFIENIDWSNIPKHVKQEGVQYFRPCTAAQDGMLAQMQHTGDLYVNALTVELKTQQHFLSIRERFVQLAASFELLRTGFVVVQNARNLPNFAMLTYFPDFLNADNIVEEGSTFLDLEAWRRRMAQEFNSNLQLPPWKILLQASTSRTLVHIAISHALFDAVSLDRMLSALISEGPFGEPRTVTPVLATILRSNCPKTEDGKAARTIFWEKHLTGAVPSRFPDLSPLCSTTGLLDFVSARCSMPLQALQEQAQQRGFTVQAIGQAAFARLLAAYIDESSVVFGTVMSGRDCHPMAMTVDFPCLTTVPTHVTCAGTNAEMIRGLMDFNARVRDYQFTPLTVIQKLFNVTFDTIFVYQSRPQCSNHGIRILEERSSAEFTLSLELEVTDTNELAIRITFQQDKVPKPHAEVMLEQYNSFLMNMAQETSCRTADTFVNMPHLRSISTPKAYSLESPVRLLHQFVERSAETDASRIAFEFADAVEAGKVESRTWTYEEINRMGNMIASLLKSLGVAPRSLVAICFDKCPEATFAMLGILKAGCAYVAIDPAAPLARKLFIIKDSAAAVLLTAQRSARRLYQGDEQTEFSSISPEQITFDAQGHIVFDIPIVYLDETDLSKEDTNAINPVSNITHKDLCYCLYTSGTTGVPKGCKITHENAVQAMRAFSKLFEGHWNAESRWLQVASFHFDVSVLEQFWTFSEGLRVVSAPRDVIFQDIPGAIRALKVTHIDLTPSLAVLLHPDDVPSLTKGVFITGGEPLKQEILDVWGSHEVIYNGYGPTETTIGVTMFVRVPHNGKPNNIGPCWPNAGAFVLRPGSEEVVLRGAVGELCIFGKLVGKGYLNRPDLTAEKFPHVASLRQRVYRTGDLVRMLHDGSFIFIGRVDSQVKLRGQRIEVNEIDSVIKEGVSTIQDALTLVSKHPKQQREQLVTFLTTSRAVNRLSEPTVIAENTGELLYRVKATCQSKVPPYMVPTHFIPVSHIPLTANNKIDERALQALYAGIALDTLQSLVAHQQYKSASLSLDERKVLDAINLVSEQQFAGVSPSTTIFELGFDSISVIKLSQAFRTLALPRVQPSVILQHPSIQGLACMTRASQASSDDRRANITAKQKLAVFQHKYRLVAAKKFKVNADFIETLAPCTPLQQGMISRALRYEDDAYFSSFRLHLQKLVDLQKLYDSWSKVYNVVSILRTRFLAHDEGHFQVVIRGSSLPYRKHTLSNDESLENAVASCKQEWRERNRFELHQPFELVLIGSGTHYILLMNIFHALYDGMSLAVLLQTVRCSYVGDEINIGPDFFSVLADGPLKQMKDAEQFWKDHMSTTKPSNSARDQKLRKINSSHLVRQLKISRRIEQERRSLSISHQALLQTCWAAALCGHSNDAIVIGTIVSGRAVDHPDIEKVIGPMFNTLPLRLSFDTPDTWATMLKKCQSLIAAMQPFQHTALRSIRKWCGYTQDEEIFDNLFVFQKDVSSLEFDNQLWRIRDDDTVGEYPLALEANLNGSDLTLTLVIQENDVAVQAKATEYLDRFEYALQAIREDVHQPLNMGQGRNNITGVGLELSQPVIQPNGTSKSHGADLLPQSSCSGWSEKGLCLRRHVSSLANLPESEIQPIQSIFELGLDSIDAIKLSSRLKSSGFKLPASKIMQSPQMRDLVNLLERHESTIEDTKQSARLSRFEQIMIRLRRQHSTSAQDVVELLPATPLQEGMIAEMLESNFHRYYNHDVLELAPDINLEKLRTAWKKLVMNTDILRARFVIIDDLDLAVSFIQVISKPTTGFFNWSSCTMRSDRSIDDILTSITAEQSLIYEKCLLMRLTAVQTPEKQYLILSLPHAMYDGWSLTLIHDAIHDLYHDIAFSSPSIAPTLQTIIEGDNEEAAQFWKHSLTGAKPCIVPIREISDEERGSVRHERLLQLSIDDIRSFCRRHGVTLQALGQTCWSLVLASLTGQLEVVYGLVLSGRETEEAQNVIFPTMNTVAFRNFIHGTVGEMLRDTQEAISAVRQFAHFPLRKSMAFTARDGPLFNTLFTYQMQPQTKDTADRAPLYRSVNSVSNIDFPLCFEMEVLGDQLMLRAARDSTALSSEEVLHTLESMDKTLRDIVEGQDTEIIDVDGDKIRILGLDSFNMKIQGPDPAQLRSNADHTERTNLTPIERAIRLVLSAVAKVPEDEITSSATIYQLGLDSISAIKVSSLLRKQGILVSVSNMLQASTVERIAQVAQRSNESSSSEKEHQQPRLQNTPSDVVQRAVKDVLVDSRIEHILPSSGGQLYMLNLWAKYQGALFYPTFDYIVHNVSDVKTICTAWNVVMEQTPALRTVLVKTDLEDTTIFQCIIGNDSQSVSTIRVGQPQEQFPAAKRPMVLLSVQPVGSASYRLSLNIHHALYDAVSLAGIMSRFQHFLRNSDETDPAVPEHENHISFYTNSSKLRTASGARDFWATYLQNLDRRISLPPSSAEPRHRFEFFESHVFPITEGLVFSLCKLDISIQALFLAAYASVYQELAEYMPRMQDNTQSLPTLRQEVIIGLYLANRSMDIEGLMDLAAPTINLLPLRITMKNEYGKSISLVERAQRVQKDLQLIGKDEHAAVTLHDIDTWTGVKVDTFVNFLKLPGTDEEDGGRAAAAPMDGLPYIESMSEGQDCRKVVELVPDESNKTFMDKITQMRASESYLYSLDVEAAVRGGELDVGVFGPTTLLGLEEAEWLVYRLKGLLEGFNG